MASEADFRILGPLEVRVAGARLRLRGPLQERALAALLGLDPSPRLRDLPPPPTGIGAPADSVDPLQALPGFGRGLLSAGDRISANPVATVDALGVVLE